MTFTGYPIELERRGELEATAAVLPFRLGDFKAPEEIDPRSWLQIEDQGQVGSCQGHALSSAVEYAYWVDTSGDVIQLSRMWAYLQSQKFDNLLGRDAGSTLAGGLRVAKELGIPFEQSFPYPGRYTTQIPAGLEIEARQHRINSHVMCRSYDDIFTFLASGAGAVEIGMAWGNAMTPRNGVIESFAAGGGGHAVLLAGYSRRKDRQGRNYLYLFNSWSKSWGNNGVAEWAPDGVDAACRHQWTVAQGLSDMIDIEPRPEKFDFVKNNIFA